MQLLIPLRRRMIPLDCWKGRKRLGNRRRFNSHKTQVSFEGEVKCILRDGAVVKEIVDNQTPVGTLVAIDRFSIFCKYLLEPTLLQTASLRINWFCNPFPPCNDALLLSGQCIFPLSRFSDLRRAKLGPIAKRRTICG